MLGLSCCCHRRRAALEDWVIHWALPAHSRPMTSARRVADVARAVRSSDQTVYVWRAPAHVDQGADPGLTSAKRSLPGSAQRRIRALESELPLRGRATGLAQRSSPQRRFAPTSPRSAGLCLSGWPLTGPQCAGIRLVGRRSRSTDGSCQRGASTLLHLQGAIGHGRSLVITRTLRGRRGLAP